MFVTERQLPSCQEGTVQASMSPFCIQVFYVLMGIGRAVYESTNKAIFADFFPGEVGSIIFLNLLEKLLDF